MEYHKEKIWYICRVFFDKGENASQLAESMSGVYGIDTVTASYVQFWFQRFRSGMPIVQTVYKVAEMIEVDLHVSSHSIAQVLNIVHKTV